MSGVDVLADLRWLSEWLSDTTPEGGEAAYDTVRKVTVAVAELIEAAGSVDGVADHASFVSGVCCCGADMDLHADPMICDHSPVDSGEYYGGMALDRLRTALAACQSPTTPLTREQEAEEVHKR